MGLVRVSLLQPAPRESVAGLEEFDEVILCKVNMIAGTLVFGCACAMWTAANEQRKVIVGSGKNAVRVATTDDACRIRL